MKTKFKISKNWGCIRTFDELVTDSKFIFQWDGHKGARPRIVLKTPINGMDCIEIDYDRYGLTTNGESVFSEHIGGKIVDSSQKCHEFIADFLKREGASDLITASKDGKEQTT
jgi:hypothetical protein